jgi:hypothetical protein
MAQALDESDATATANELAALQLSDNIYLQKYSWSQTLSDVSIFVPLPANTSAKMLDIVIQRQGIRVSIKGGETILSGVLSATVYPDECFWTLEKGSVEITLNKVACTTTLRPCGAHLTARVSSRVIHVAKHGAGF